jgi:hypothetical protein
LYIRIEHECSSANLGNHNSSEVAVSDYKEKYAKFEVLPARIMKKAVLWAVTPCNLAEVSVDLTASFFFAEKSSSRKNTSRSFPPKRL